MLVCTDKANKYNYVGRYFSTLECESCHRAPRSNALFFQRRKRNTVDPYRYMLDLPHDGDV